MRLEQLSWCLAGLIGFVVGCGEEVSSKSLAKLEQAALPKQEETTPSSSTPAEPEPEEPAPDAAAPMGETYGHGAPIVLKSTTDEANLAKAEAGVGKRGQGYGGGIITEPIRQFFRAQDNIGFLNMQNTLKTYRALNNDKNPPTIEEFDREILKATGITLTELSPGQYYVYDPDAKDIEQVLLVAQPPRP